MENIEIYKGLRDVKIAAAGWHPSGAAAAYHINDIVQFLMSQRLAYLTQLISQAMQKPDAKPVAHGVHVGSPVIGEMDTPDTPLNKEYGDGWYACDILVNDNFSARLDLQEYLSKKFALEISQRGLCATNFRYYKEESRMNRGVEHTLFFQVEDPISAANT